LRIFLFLRTHKLRLKVPPDAQIRLALWYLVMVTPYILCRLRIRADYIGKWWTGQGGFQLIIDYCILNIKVEFFLFLWANTQVRPYGVWTGGIFN